MTPVDLAGAESAFREAMRARGLEPPRDLIADGKLHRCGTTEKPTGKDGAYVLHLDGLPAGGFENHSDGGGWQNWCSRPEGQLSPSELAGHRARVDTARIEREAAVAAGHAKARDEAARIWDRATPARSHPYLAKKGVKAHGLSLLEATNALIVPLRDAGGVLHSVQFIPPDGKDKRFLPDGRKKGCLYVIGDLGSAARICVAEGFATGASIFEATGHATVIAFDCGNLRAVAEAIHGRYSHANMIICADDDIERKDGNIGLRKATETARAVGGFLAVPDFGEDRPARAKDFNDLHQARGLEAVRRCIDAAGVPVPSRLHAGAAQTDADDTATVGATVVSMERPTWREPEPLPEELPPVPGFDDRLLPDQLRPWLVDVAERTQCPPEYAAVGALVALGSVVGRNCGIRPKQHDDWTVIPNLWGAVVGPPSAMKSPALAEVLRPLKRLAAEAQEAHGRAIAGHAATLAELDARRSVIRDSMKKAMKRGLDTTGLRAEFEAAADPITPTERRYIVNDATVEKLGELLNQNPRGLLHYRDELSGWLASLDRDGHENDRAFFLEAWDGRGQYSYDRIGRGTLHIRAACVSMLGGIQPGPLAQYLRAAVRGGVGDDGLPQRFQLLVYPDVSRTWRNVDRWPDSAARDRAFDIFRRLDGLTPEALGVPSEDGIPALHFEPHAQDFFNGWREELMMRLRTGDEHPAIESHLGKFPSLLPSLALVCHLADAPSMPPGPVTLSVCRRAAAWCDLLEAHARRVYHTVSAEELKGARLILARLRSGKLTAPFAIWEVLRPGWAGLTNRETVGKALTALEDRGWVRRRVVGDTGGGPRTEYLAHPSLGGRDAA